MGASELVRKYLESEAGSELLGEMVKMAAELLMDAEVDQLCGAGYGERSESRLNSRNGHRKRRWDTRGGHHRARGAQAAAGLVLPRATRTAAAGRAGPRLGCLPGLGGGCLDPARRRPGEGHEHRRDVQVPGLRAGQVARCQGGRVPQPPPRRRPYTYLWLDALFHKVREGGRVATVIAAGANAEGHREVLGVDCFTTEDGAGWTAFLRGLVARGLSGVALVVSDAHEGLKNAIAAVLPGATWQRCRTHFMPINLLTRVPKSAQAMVATLVRTVFVQSDDTQVKAQFARVIDLLDEKFPAAAELLSECEADLIAFSDFPVEHWRQIWSNNTQERLNKELRRRTDVVGIFPNRASLIRLCGAVLAEQHDEWAVARRYMSTDSLAKARRTATTDEAPDHLKGGMPAELSAVG